MLIGHFTEQPWQDDQSGLMGTQSTDLSISNAHYNPQVGSQLYNRYLDEKVYAEEMGFCTQRTFTKTPCENGREGENSSEV